MDNTNEHVLQLLITGGFLNPDKLQEARDIIGGCAPSPVSGSLEEAAMEYADKVVLKESGGIHISSNDFNESIKAAFLAGASYVKGGEWK